MSDFVGHIVEVISARGIKTTPADEKRMSTPHPGDLVRFADELRKYPVSYATCRIVEVENGIVHMVDGMGSAFLQDDGGIDVSGGPFFSMPAEFLVPMKSVETSSMWNWGNNRPGAGQGIHYKIDRPLFRAIATPANFEVRYATSEEHARQGGEYRHGLVGPDFELYSVTKRKGDTDVYRFIESVAKRNKDSQ